MSRFKSFDDNFFSMQEYWGGGGGGLTVTGGSIRCTLLSSISISLYTDMINEVKYHSIMRVLKYIPCLGTQCLHFTLLDNFTATKLFYLSNGERFFRHSLKHE